MELSELTKKRREHLKSCEENDDRSHQIIAGMYSDPSHFIYEILQNADDAKASNVQFALTNERLEITHNGKKAFDYKDVESITTIGSSAKQDDINAIGKFGAGFKSVFAVTKTPQIHSGEYHFEIQDFIVPEQLPGINNNSKTTIILPFNHCELSCDKAYKQINERLRSLKSESLLFLHNVKEIQWKTRIDSGHYLADISSDRACIISQYNNEEKQQDYLLFNSTIKIEDKEIKLSIAYRLNNENNNIVPQNDAELFVFFPTKVITGLRFLLHTSYKTTPNRETIPFEDDQNRKLTAGLANLVSFSILEIKKRGFLYVSFLEMLPLDDKKAHPLYIAVYEKVKAALSKEELLPTTIENGYTTANHALLARGKELTMLLDTNDNNNLFGKEHWLSTDITYNKRELHDYLIRKIGIEEKGMEDFANSISGEFIVEKSDEWMINFYAAISDNTTLFREKTSYQSKGVLREKPIIRLDNDTHVNPDNEKDELQVYLPAEQDSEFKTVKRVFAENEKSKEFLNNLGLKEPDKVEEIKVFIAPKYEEDKPDIQQDIYIQDFNKVVSIWNNSDDYKKLEIINILKEVNFVGAIDINNDFLLQKPEDVYFATEALRMWFENNSKDSIYFIVNDLVDTKYKSFLSRLGVCDKINLAGNTPFNIDRHSRHEHGVNGFNPDFNIQGLAFSLHNINFNRSLYLFKVLLNHVNKIKGCTESTSSTARPYVKGRERLSEAGELLENHKWLYNKETKLIDKPIREISIEDLNDEYKEEHENIEKLIDALGMKLDVVKAFEEKTGYVAFTKEQANKFKELLKQEKEREQSSRDEWKPTYPPEDVTIKTDDVPLEEIQTKDLSNQGNDEPTTGIDDKDKPTSKEINDKPVTTSESSKVIGRLGEEYAKRWLEEKYPEDEVVWLNQSGKVGEGYDFVIKNGEGNVTAYYEVKTKLDENPALFGITGAQWGWAKKLHKDGKGNMYIILLVSNADTVDVKVKEYPDPVTLWKEGKIYANPVNIEL